VFIELTDHLRCPAAHEEAYLVLLPHARVLTWFVFVLREIPAGLYLLFWFVFQLWVGSFSLVHPEQGGGVAFFAHVGGFVAGVALIFLFRGRRAPPLREVLR